MNETQKARNAKIMLILKSSINKNYLYKNCLKITKNESFQHRYMKYRIADWAVENKHTYYCEPKLVGYFCQPDLIVIINNVPIGFEIVNSEKEKSLESKKKRYPSWLKMQVVNITDNVTKILESYS